MQSFQSFALFGDHLQRPPCPFSPQPPATRKPSGASPHIVDSALGIVKLSESIARMLFDFIEFAQTCGSRRVLHALLLIVRPELAFQIHCETNYNTWYAVTPAFSRVNRRLARAQRPTDEISTEAARRARPAEPPLPWLVCRGSIEYWWFRCHRRVLTGDGRAGHEVTGAEGLRIVRRNAASFFRGSLRGCTGPSGYGFVESCRLLRFPSRLSSPQPT